MWLSVVVGTIGQPPAIVMAAILDARSEHILARYGFRCVRRTAFGESGIRNHRAAGLDRPFNMKKFAEKYVLAF
jgi:hypothetical protein